MKLIDLKSCEEKCDVGHTIDSKIIRAFEIIRVKKLIPNAVYEIYICEVMIFKLYTVYKKQEMIKIGNQIREKSQVLSQMLE